MQEHNRSRCGVFNLWCFFALLDPKQKAIGIVPGAFFHSKASQSDSSLGYVRPRSVSKQLYLRKED